MLPKNQRVKRQDFPKIMKEGLVFYSPHLSLVVLSDDLSKLKASIVVSSKVAKTSVGRHLIKRQIGSLLEGKVELIKNCEVIIICKRGFLIKERGIIEKELDFLLSSSGLLK